MLIHRLSLILALALALGLGLLARAALADTTPPGSSPLNFVPVGDVTVFTTDDPDGAGAELWATDGTAAGTRRLFDLCPGPCFGTVAYAARTGEKLFFVSQLRLWVTDGTPQGTVPLTQPPVVLPSPFNVRPRWIPERGILIFGAEGVGTGLEPWVTDGTPGGTRRLADIAPGPSTSSMQGITAFGGMALFFANPLGQPVGLWKTDGTPEGTVLVENTPFSAGTFVNSTVISGGLLYFSAYGTLAVTDGTASGTRTLRDFPFSGSSALHPAGVHGLIALGNGVAFVVDDGLLGEELWVSDGTEAGTRPVSAFGPPDPFAGLADVWRTVIRGTLYFSADDGIHGYELWASDGTPEGTRLVLDLCPGPCSTSVTLLRDLGGAIYFAANDGVHGNEFWRTDGTAAGMVRITDLCPGSCSAFVIPQAEINGWVLFSDLSPDGTYTLWRTDGTPQGTSRLTFFQVSQQIALNQGADGRIYLAGYDPVHGLEPWVTDGTPEGTRLLADLVPQDEPGSGEEGLTLTAGEVACDASRLRGFLERLSPTPSPSKAPGVNLTLTASGDFAGLAYSGNGPGTAEHHLAFAANPEETTLLRNPARLQLASLSLTRNPTLSDLVAAANSPDALSLRLNPTLNLSSPDPATLITLDNRTGNANATNARPGRGLGPLLAACHQPLPAEDVHVLRVLARIARADVPNGPARLALFRGEQPGVYRIDVYPPPGINGQLSAELKVTRADDGTLQTGILRLLPPCAGGEAEGCAPLSLHLIRPVFSGQFWDQSVTVRQGVGGPGNVAFGWGALLGGTTWMRPLEGDSEPAGGSIDEAAVTCDARRLGGFLGRLRASTPNSPRTVGVNLATSATGDFAGIAYTGNTHLAFSSNPEETTLLRNPARLQLASLSLSRNALNSDLVAPRAADALVLALDPTRGTADPANLLTLDNVSGPTGRPSGARPGRGLADLLRPCHLGLTAGDVHLLRVLSKIVRAEAPGVTSSEIALFRGLAPDSYRIDAYLHDSSGTPLGRLSAELTVTRAGDGSLAGGDLRLLGACTAGQTDHCTSYVGTAALLLARPAGAGQTGGATPYRVETSGGPAETVVDWGDLLGGTSWRRPL
jgi:ELWxxDGT repeat protein